MSLPIYKGRWCPKAIGQNKLRPNKGLPMGKRSPHVRQWSILVRENSVHKPTIVTRRRKHRRLKRQGKI